VNEQHVFEPCICTTERKLCRHCHEVEKHPNHRDLSEAGGED
jgi:hypothetical protein